jgi:4-diphosphocytidyl-2-C-methyl-D-erythritol kinase
MNKVTASAPAKVNLIFEVGHLEPTGYHSVNSLFLALELREEVSISNALQGTGITISVKGEDLPARHIAAVPTDESNLVAKAVRLLSKKMGIDAPDIQIDILKRIPVAGGMAGGSADAAATLVAFNEYANEYLGTAKLSIEELLEAGSELGSDVPFCVLGKLAVGTDRGNQLSAIPEFSFVTHWVLAISQQGLSTPTVFAKFDELGESSGFRDLVELRNSLNTIEDLAGCLRNDLQASAIALMPQLSTLIGSIESLGAMRAIVSGSGPTIAALCSSKEQAETIAATLNGQGIFAQTASSPALGANLEG